MTRNSTLVFRNEHGKIEKSILLEFLVRDYNKNTTSACITEKDWLLHSEISISFSALHCFQFFPVNTSFCFSEKLYSPTLSNNSLTVHLTGSAGYIEPDVSKL